MSWTGPPRMEDMATLADVALAEPLETHLRLEGLRRELGEAIQADPLRVANFAWTIEQGRSILERQMRHALLMLAERADELDRARAQVAYLQGRLAQVEQRQQLRRSIWSWLS